MTATKDARRATRIVVGGERHLAAMKPRARRLERRHNRAALRGGVDIFEPRRITGWEIA